MRHVAVTGGTGFIGSWVVRRLVERGYRVRVVRRPGSPADALSGLDVEHMEADVRDPSALEGAFRDCDTVFHIAGYAHLWAPDAGLFETVNHRGTVNVIGAARAAATVRRLIYTSSGLVVKAAERTPPGGYTLLHSLGDAVGPYGRSKWLAARAVLSANRKGMPAVIVAPTAPLGPGDVNLTPPTHMLADFLDGRLKAILDARLNIVDVRDCAEGHVLAAERGQTGRIYVLGGRNVRLSDLLAAVAELTGRKPPRARVPYRLAMVFARLSEALAGRYTRRPPLATTAGVELSLRSQWFDNAEARALGTRFRPLRETLQDAVSDLIARGVVTGPALAPPPGPGGSGTGRNSI